MKKQVPGIKGIPLQTIKGKHTRLLLNIVAKTLAKHQHRKTLLDRLGEATTIEERVTVLEAMVPKLDLRKERVDE